MPRTGGKIIGLAKDDRGKPTKEVSPTDPNAIQWMDTNNYKTLSKEDALAKHTSVFGSENRPVAPGSPMKSRSAPAVGLGRRKTRHGKTRRGKKSRRITRKR
jgi:hypothetical protein